MKKTLRAVVLLAAVIALVFSLASCRLDFEKDPWDSATYKEDKTFGAGATALAVEVKVGENLVTFTINTDKATVGEALLEHGLIAGEDGAYGLYVKVVNGITADYDVDQSYWAFYINGEYGMTGVDATAITAGSVYRLEYTK